MEWNSGKTLADPAVAHWQVNLYYLSREMRFSSMGKAFAWADSGEAKMPRGHVCSAEICLAPEKESPRWEGAGGNNGGSLGQKREWEKGAGNVHKVEGRGGQGHAG